MSDTRKQLKLAAGCIGLVIKDDFIWPFASRRHAIDARTAQVTVSDNTGRRLTLTRAMTIGLFALGAKKSTGNYIVFVTSPDGSFEVKVDSKHGDRVQRFAALFNAVYANDVAHSGGD